VASHLELAPDTPPLGTASAARTRIAFAAVALDIESTISGVEGINWLAARRGPEVAREIADLTERAMRGEIAFEDVYGARLAAIRPTEAEVTELSEEYRKHMAPRVLETLDELRTAGVRLALISGGIRQALQPLASTLGFTHAELFAVRVAFDANGDYAGFDERSPLTSTNGKGTVLQRLYFPRPLLAVGDGATDLAMRSAADAFAAYTGFAHRVAVVRAADHEICSFTELRDLVLS
jgi:phosphoserine phosphatase